MRASMWWRRAVTYFKRGRLDDELAEEISTHIDLRRRALIEQGWPAPEAAAEARRQFGNVTAVPRAIARSLGQRPPHSVRAGCEIRREDDDACARPERDRRADHHARCRHQRRDLRLRHQPAPRSRSAARRHPRLAGRRPAAARADVSGLRGLPRSDAGVHRSRDVRGDEGRSPLRPDRPSRGSPARCWPRATTSPRFRCRRPLAARSGRRTISRRSEPRLRS